jgi:TrmH RNA methyltransferase
LFRWAPERPQRLFYTEATARLAGPLCRVLAQNKKPYRLVSDEEMAKVAGTPLHQGMVAIARPKPEMRLDARALDDLKAQGGVHFVLDGIGNPHNLGAIARSLAFFGFKNLILTDHPDQAGLSSAAFRVAEGGLDALKVYRAPGFWPFMARQGSGVRLIGTALTREGFGLEALEKSRDLTFMVLGNEERGLSSQAINQCSTVLRLEGAGVIQSLNVAQTAAILAYGLKP